MSTNVIWAPFDNKIYIWGVYRNENTKEVGARMYIYDVDTKTYKSFPKTDDYFSEDEYTFSPDGKRIAYYRWENDGRKTLWTMNPDRTDQRKLIDWRYMISDLSWTE
jgi:Tol biopolymer transport system component